jgi:hypothetical protein
LNLRLRPEAELFEGLLLRELAESDRLQALQEHRPDLRLVFVEPSSEEGSRGDVTIVRTEFIPDSHVQHGNAISGGLASRGFEHTYRYAWFLQTKDALDEVSIATVGIT